MTYEVIHKETGAVTIHTNVERVIESLDRFELVDKYTKRKPITSTSYHKSKYSFRRVSAGTKRLNVTVQCMAVYNSAIDVPEHMSLEEAVAYAKEHLAEINCGPLEYIGDSDVLDEESCCFDTNEE